MIEGSRQSTCLRQSSIAGLLILQPGRRDVTPDILSFSWEGWRRTHSHQCQLFTKYCRNSHTELSSVTNNANWPRQFWFQSLLQLMVDLPLLFPQNQDLRRRSGTKARFTGQLASVDSVDVVKRRFKRRVFLSKLPF